MRSGRFLDAEISASIDALLARVSDEDRTVLFEHEVYEILHRLSIRVPVFRFLPRSAEVDQSILEPFDGDQLVLKIVSPDVLHKARVGGVRQVSNNLAAVRCAIKRMIDEVAASRIAGVLIVEKVDVAPGADAEILIGFRDSEAFGPVMVLGSGGTAAERYGGTFGRPNLALAPLSLEESRRFVASARGVEIPAQYVHDLSLLAAHYSRLGHDRASHCLEDLEINPLALDRDGHRIALDGLGRLCPRDTTPYQVEPNRSGLKNLFHPQGVAVVGVSSSDSHKLGNIIAGCIADAGRQDLYLVNPKGGEASIGGKTIPIHRSISEIDGRVDLAVISIPAPLTPEIVADAKRKGVGVVVLIPGGFSEVDGETTIEDRLLEIIGHDGPRILGPNCMGLLVAGRDGQSGINTYFIPERKLPLRPERQSGLAIISQSGAAILTIVDKLRHASYPCMLTSFGNQLDVEAADLVAVSGEDACIDVIGIYLEGFRPYGGRRLVHAIREVDKPVVLYKAGRTAAGARAAASHTAAIACDYSVALAGLEASGALVADTLIEFEDLLKTFALLAGRRASGLTVAGVVNAGFESTNAADNCGELMPASFGAATIETLRGFLPAYASVNPFMDLTPMSSVDIYIRTIETLLLDDDVHSLFISIVPHTPALPTTNDDLESAEHTIADRIIALYQASDKPVTMSVNGGDQYTTLYRRMEEGGIPTFPTARRAIRSLECWVRYYLRDRG